MTIRRYGLTTGQRPRKRAWTGGGLAIVAILAGACSSGASHPSAAGSTSEPSSGTFVPSTVPLAATTTTLDPTVAAILADYRTEETVYLAVAEHYPVEPADPRLPQVMTGTELDIVQRNLTLAALHDEYASGTVDLAPVVTSVDGTTATISDCLFDHGVILNGKTHQAVSTANTERHLENVTMVFEGGTWKNANEELEGSGCVPAAGS